MAQPLKEVQHVVQIDRLPDVDLILRPGQIIEQKLQHQRAAQPAPFQLEIGKAQRQIALPDVRSADEPGVFHRLGKAVALLRAGGGAPMFADLPQIFAADGFVAAPALGAAEPAALVAEKFYLVLFGLGECIQGIEGLVQPEVRHDIPELRPPDLCLNPLKTIGDQIMEAVELHQHLKGKAAREKTLEYLRDVGIADPEVRFAQYPHEFSGGMRQRVVIAIAVACNPQILICDEPTTALDVTIQAQILQLLKEMQVKYNLTIVLITHDLGVVANIADRVAVMYAGDIVEIGTSDEIYYDPRHPYTWALLSSMPQMGIKGEDLFNIQGTPPNLFTEIHSDAFAPRNPQALKIDFVKRPPYFTVSPTHKAKTWLLDPRAPKVEPPAAVKLLKEEGMQDA